MGQTEIEIAFLIRIVKEFESFKGWGRGYLAKKCGVKARRNVQEEAVPPSGNVLQHGEKRD